MENAIKISNKDPFIPIILLNNIVEVTSFEPITIEETDSELFFKTYHGVGVIKFKNGSEYEGNVKYGIMNSTPEVPSVMKFKNGTIYTGDIKQNKISGKGKYVFPEGSVYYGEVLNGLRHGKGTYENTEENLKYDGQWNNGLKHGTGELLINDMHYEGEFYEGVKQGYGKMKWISTSNFYEGYFKDNHISGNGCMVWVDTFEKYIGQWKDNLQNGIGNHIWYETRGELKLLKNRYLGEWKNGLRHGYGVFFYSNGSKYEGLWENNMKNDFGVFTYQDGTQYIGYFKKDRMDKSRDGKFNEITDNLDKKKNTASNLNSTNSVFNKKNPKNSALNVEGKYPTILEDPNGENLENRSEVGLNIRQSSNYPGKKLAPIDNNKKGGKVKNDKKEMSVDESFADNGFTKIQSDGNNPFSTLLDISDIVDADPEIEINMIDVNNVMLRYLNDLKIIYKYYSGSRDPSDRLNESQAFGMKTGEEESFKTNTIKNDNYKTPSINKNFTSQVKVDGKLVDVIMTEGLNINLDIGYTLELKDVWKFLRDVNLLNSEFTLADFNRLFYKGSRNYFEVFSQPEELNENQVYNFLQSAIKSSKENFIKRYNRNGIYSNYPTSNVFYPLKYEIEGKKYEFEYHNKKNIVLLRHFYEIIVRIANHKFQASKDTLDKKIKDLIDNYIKTSAKIKALKKTTNSTVKETSSLNNSIFDPIYKNFESAFEMITLSREPELIGMFKHIASCSKINLKLCDLTLNYRYFYNYVIRKDDELKKYYDKYEYISIINKYHTNKITIDERNKYTLQTLSYIENLLDIEMIYYEFCELVTLIMRKYCVENNLAEKKETLDVIFNKIKELIMSCSSLDKMSDKYMYYYKELPYHKEYSNLLKEKRKKLIEEENKRKEKIRFEKENAKMAYFEECLIRQGDDEEEQEEESEN